jgi:hypothetical protein
MFSGIRRQPDQLPDARKLVFDKRSDAAADLAIHRFSQFLHQIPD